jgi:hypothetical protein
MIREHNITGDGSRVRVRVGNKIKITLGIRRTQESRIDVARITKIGVPLRDIGQSRQDKKVNLKCETRRGISGIRDDVIRRRMQFN